MHPPIIRTPDNPQAALALIAAPVALYYGQGRMPLAWIVPAGAGLWRIRGRDRLPSDVMNLTRAKDAALAIAERGPPARNRRLFHWRKEPSKAPAEGSPVARTAPAGVRHRPEPGARVYGGGLS
jgi:hypothetical protein